MIKTVKHDEDRETAICVTSILGSGAAEKTAEPSGIRCAGPLGRLRNAEGGVFPQPCEAMPVLIKYCRSAPVDIPETNGRHDARNFHLPDGTTLVTMHASSNLDLDVHWLGLN